MSDNCAYANARVSAVCVRVHQLSVDSVMPRAWLRTHTPYVCLLNFEGLIFGLCLCLKLMDFLSEVADPKRIKCTKLPTCARIYKVIMRLLKLKYDFVLQSGSQKCRGMRPPRMSSTHYITMTRSEERRGDVTSLTSP